MKFLLEFVACCGSASRSPVPAPASPPEADTRSLVRADRRHRGRKRGRLAPSRTSSAAEWRPSLRAISEDDVVAAVEEKEEERAVLGSERASKRKVAPTPRGAHARDRHDFRRTEPPVMIPAFSPTVFLF